MHLFLEVTLFTTGFFLAYRSGWKAGLTRGLSTQLKIMFAKVKEFEEKEEQEEQEDKK